MVPRLLLIVEDQPTDEALTLRALRDAEVAAEVLVARDGAEALELLLTTGPWARRPRVQPDVIFRDLRLPKVDGFEVLMRIRADQRLQRVPVVVFSSSAREEDRTRAYQLRANSYVSKPIDVLKYSEAVRQLSSYWLTLNKPPPTSVLPV